MIHIIIPLYNGIEFLEETLRSVVAQTYTHWKATIGINGHGATGGDVYIQAAGIVTAISDSRISIFVQPSHIDNKSKSLNDLVRRLDATDADWICLLDADDLWLPTKLEEQVKLLETQHDAEVIGTTCTYFGERSGAPSLPAGALPQGVTLRVNPIINSSVMFRKKYAHWDESNTVYAIEDYDLWLRLDAAHVRFFNIDQALVKHRIHKTSAFNSKHVDPAALVARHAAAIQTAPPVCVVTAFYPLPRAKHSRESYRAWIELFCRTIQANLIVFTNATYAPLFKELRNEHNTIVYERPFNFFKMTSPHYMEFWNKQYARDPEKHIHSPELYATWALKQEWVNAAIDLNPFMSSWFVWCDVGILRIPKDAPYYTTFPNAVPRLCERGRMAFLAVKPLPTPSATAPIPETTLGGGCIAGDAAAWRDFGTAYERMLSTFDDRGWFAGKDQRVFYAMLTERATKKPFRVFNSSRVVDPWMSFPPILGGALRANIDTRFEVPIFLINN
jgi:glycosyltransferase involved in cell wall biosynthesis